LILVRLIDFKETKDKAKNFKITDLKYAQCQTSLVFKLSQTRTQHGKQHMKSIKDSR
jgi:hypothetical protein